MFHLQLNEFAERYEKGIVPLKATFPADLLTPVGAFRALLEEGQVALLFESVERGAKGRYSAVVIDPDEGIEINDSDVFDVIYENGRVRSHVKRNLNPTETPIDALRAFIENNKFSLPEGLPSIAAGVFGYVGYDCVRYVEDIGARKAKTLNVPDARLIRPQVIFVFDHVQDILHIVMTIAPREDVSAEIAYHKAEKKLRHLLAILHAAQAAPKELQPSDKNPEKSGNMTKASYCDAVQSAKKHIYEGDIFQVVLSQRFSQKFREPPLAFYRALRHVNPAPFLFHLDFGDFCVTGASPEILVRVQDNTITIRPIAGTRKRGATDEEDIALAEELLSDVKERAEHLMLLDLGRNDVGRYAEIGSVTVAEQFQIERYSHVMHIISETRGTLRKDCTALDALIGGFPAGTVSGAPKVRAMQIINDMEPDARQIYAGAIGYFSANGDMDTCIALRTAVIQKGQIHIQAGAGVVADSIPENEYQECVNKAAALFRAVELAKNYN